MPELPEVETTCQGIKPMLVGNVIQRLIVRNGNLRWPVDHNLGNNIHRNTIRSVKRRAKYILINMDLGTLMIHLGMTGRLRILNQAIEPKKHDHVDIVLTNGSILRYNDTRRFGSIHWIPADSTHFLLDNLGIEPLSETFNGTFLYRACQKRNIAIKTCIMNQSIVVGIGNIYASEALFLAGVCPKRRAKTITKEEANAIAKYSKACLESAIQSGGTTLQDFRKADGNPGYFQNKLYVYGRHNKPCLVCNTTIEKCTQTQRSTFFCTQCQR